jgi:hydroxysqualene dehydroxylase
VDRDARGLARVNPADMSCEGPPRGANCAPAGGSEAAKPRAWGDHPIAVIGGGWAGCAAAVTLAAAGHCVELHEAARDVGGRARRVVRDGLPLDNGEHLMLGAYTATLDLAAQLHAGDGEPWIRTGLAIGPLGKDQPNAIALRARKLPAPFGLLLGVIAARGLTASERVATLRWFARVQRSGFQCSPQATVAQWMNALPPRVRNDLWGPLCLAALNTPIERASAQVFANVLRETFGSGARATDVVAPRGGLAAAIPDRTREWLLARGHRVQTSSRVRIVDTANGVRFVDPHGTFHVEAAIVAVGPHQLASAFDASLAGDSRIAAALHDVERFGWEPITTVYLGYAAPVVLPTGLVRLDDAPGQWVFDRADILARAVTSDGAASLRALLSVVVSAHGPHDVLDHAALVAATDAQLRRLRGSLPPLRWSQVIEEKRATYACVPALSHPACGHLTGRVYLAGDYTYGAFPATLEAAVRSGRLAAQALMRDLSR